MPSLSTKLKVLAGQPSEATDRPMCLRNQRESRVCGGLFGGSYEIAQDRRRGEPAGLLGQMGSHPDLEEQ